MRLAFYTYSYTDRLEMPLEPALEKIAATGYAGIDISGTHGKSADPGSVTPDLRKRTRETAARLNLTIEAIITHATLADSLFTNTPLDLDGSVDLAADVGAPLVVFHMGGPKEDEARRAEAWPRVVDYLKARLVYAEERNVKLAVDGIWKDWLVETPESFLELHAEIGHPLFGINYDPCYLTLLGLDPSEIPEQWGDRIFHAHLKDHIGTYPDWEHKIPGQGHVDYLHVIQSLRETGFSEAISIETFTDMDFDESCDIGYRTFHSLLAATETGR